MIISNNTSNIIAEDKRLHQDATEYPLVENLLKRSRNQDDAQFHNNLDEAFDDNDCGDKSEQSEIMYGFSDLTSANISNDACNKDGISIKALSQHKLKKRLLVEFASQNMKKTGKIIEKKKKKSTKKLTHDDKYFYAIARVRKEDTNHMVEKLRCQFQNNKLKYDQLSERILLSKALRLKWLPTSFLSPIKECRFMDYVFPLDSEMFISDCNNPKNLIFGLEKIKKITHFEKDLTYGFYNLCLEENNPVKDNNPGNFFQFEYYKKWLMSLNNEKASAFKESLENHQKDIQRITFQIAEVDINYFNL